MEISEKRRNIIIIVVLCLVAIVSFFFLSGVASSEENFAGTYSMLDEKRTTVMELMAGAAAASTAISLLPGDAGTPIAEQMADMSGYFMFILGAICVEKWLVTITGFLAFRIIIPIACGLMILAQLVDIGKLKSIGIKLILFALMVFAVIPVSGLVTEKIDASYEATMKQTIEDTQNKSKDVKNKVGDEKDDNVIEKIFNKVKGGVSGKLEEFEDLLSRLTESIAVLIVTSCVIPIAVLAFFIWIIKLLTGVDFNVPRIRMSKILKK